MFTAKGARALFSKQSTAERPPSGLSLWCHAGESRCGPSRGVRAASPGGAERINSFRSSSIAAGTRREGAHRRHALITELAESGAGDQTVMDIAGHVSRQMLARYSHIRMSAKRNALEGIIKKPA